MSEQIKHECGIALIRLRKPLDHFIDKYKTPAYGLNKLHLLMEKQRNRGQDGTGVACIKLDTKPGHPYIDRRRSVQPNSLTEVFQFVEEKAHTLLASNPEKKRDTTWLKENIPFIGELYLGHLRYGTYGRNSIDFCHPMLRRNNWRSRNLVVAGNFNMTNVGELFQKLVHLGQHPPEQVDTVTVLEKIGHFLDEANDEIYYRYRDAGLEREEIRQKIDEELDLADVLSKSCRDFDGGYAIEGLTGYGDMFVVRDPSGIRPAYWYADDEVVVVASEKAAIKTAFGAPYSKIKEVSPGCAFIAKQNGTYFEKQVLDPLPQKSCSFERIYFSRGTDPEIYHERKLLGKLLCNDILDAVEGDLENTIFSYVPNTAETSFLGMVQGIDEYLIGLRKRTIAQNDLTDSELDRILSLKPRVEKLVIKDAKLRTFIADGAVRDDMVMHGYDTTYELVKKGLDTLVIIDDSIVRGTTLEKSIIKMLDRLGPKKIIIVSSAPQIRYPDCYGIDMAKMGEFVAFRAMINLIKRDGKEDLIDKVYNDAKASLSRPLHLHDSNQIQRLYSGYTHLQISDEIGKMLKSDDIKADVTVIYQTVESLHKACPNHLGDWYFTGDYPTPGGRRVANQAFVNYVEGTAGRAY